MSQANNGKFSHARSLSDLPQTLLSQEGLLFQSPQKAAQLMGFSTPKVNKNRYRLKPLPNKKTRYGEGDETPIETTSRFSRMEKKSLSIVTDPNSSQDASTPLGSQSAALGSSSKFSKHLVSATTKYENRPLGHMRSGSDTKFLIDKHNLNLMTPVSATKKENSTRLIPITDEEKFGTRFLADSRQNKEKFKSVRESIAASSRPSVRGEVVSNQSGLDLFRHLVFQPTVHQEALKKYASLVMRGLNYSINLLRPPPMEFIKTKQFAIQEPKDKPKKTLLLDLDETLIHTNPEMMDPERLLPIPGDHMTPPIRLKIRPHARKFLRRMKEHFEIFVFTASCTAYAQLVVKELDPENKMISYVLDRSHCLETRNGLYIKDLRIIKNRDLKNMIIVDNLVHSFGFQIDNGVPILEWRGQQDDEELKYLTNYLLEAKKYDDVREFNRERLKLAEMVNYKLDE